MDNHYWHQLVPGPFSQLLEQYGQTKLSCRKVPFGNRLLTTSNETLKMRLFGKIYSLANMTWLVHLLLTVFLYNDLMLGRYNALAYSCLTIIAQL